ncbi:MAG: diguanylate cyclase [Mogibacterium sp.]|nr:diguanylate cyclase [Mogibacterium sp.]
MENGKAKFSLKKKLVLLIVTVIVATMLVAGFFSYKSLTDVTRTLYTNRSRQLSKTAAESVDPQQVKLIRDQVMEIYDSTDEKVSSDEWGSPEFEAYLQRYQHIKDTAEFKETQQKLRMIQDNNNLQAVYLVWLDTDSEATVYLVDASHHEICEPGCFDAVIYDVDRKALEDPENGIAPDVTNTKEYGWIVAAGSPVFCDGELVAFAGTDISMNAEMQQRNRFLLLEFAALLAVAAVFILISLRLIDRMLIEPINKLSDTSEKYWSGERSTVRHEFSQLDIRTGDEIEALADSMKQMEQNINDHIASILDATTKLIATREHADAMDRAANIDALTKIRNKRAYDLETERLRREIADGSARFGLAMVDLNDLKRINDKYGHDKGDEAICALCQLICSVFVHSPVFRIGGDEFIVLLENHDYEHLDELKKAFSDEIEKAGKEKEPWKAISAAIGYAIFDPKRDSEIESVFKRADQDMYERKKKMKSRRR